MKPLVVLVEGNSEKWLDDFIHQLLTRKLPDAPQVQTVNMGGKDSYLKEVAARVQRYAAQEIALAMFGLLDLYRFADNLKGFDYSPNSTVAEKVGQAREHVVSKIAPQFRSQFHQHFAVHEFEAYLLSDPKVFNSIDISDLTDEPEAVNFDSPPSRRLIQRYEAIGREYRKQTMARFLLPKVDPTLVYEKCLYFRAMIDEMIETVSQAK